MLQHWAPLCRWCLQDQGWKHLACEMDHCFGGHNHHMQQVGVLLLFSFSKAECFLLHKSAC